MTTVGYGDITPQNDDERIFTMLSMMVGGAFYGAPNRIGSDRKVGGRNTQVFGVHGDGLDL